MEIYQLVGTCPSYLFFFYHYFFPPGLPGAKAPDAAAFKLGYFFQRLMIPKSVPVFEEDEYLDEYYDEEEEDENEKPEELEMDVVSKEGSHEK